MTTRARLIEYAFPLKQTSLDSVREKYGPRGHISGFHLWPARRPLAASRAALIATLLSDPGTIEARQDLCDRLAGRVVKRLEKKKMPNGSTVEREKLDTEGGILQWGREADNRDTVVWFREEIRKAYGGRAPKVLDPFSGGGAIPFEAMRMGAEATASDINPVAWLVLKCTLEYPQRFSGQSRKLPTFALRDEDFMLEFFTKYKGMSKGMAAKALERLGRRVRDGEQTNLDFGVSQGELDADLSWHFRAWGRWVLDRARRELVQYFPTYADFEPLKDSGKPFERQPMQLVPDKDGVADVSQLNREFSPDYMAVKSNPRWVAKPTVAYLWTRTVACKNCRATIPLLKTRWLCRKDGKRIVLTVTPRDDGTGVAFAIDNAVPPKGGNAAQKREHDKKVGAGNMSRAGAKCPCCPAIMTMEDIRVEGQAGRLGSQLTTVVVETSKGKAYRLPTPHELEAARPTRDAIESAFSDVPFGVPDEPTPRGGGTGAARAFSVQGYGIMRWRDLFTKRQLIALGRFVAAIQAARVHAGATHYPSEWVEALTAYLGCALDRLVDHSTTLATWYLPGENAKHTFVRYALPITWDYAETNSLFDGGGSWQSATTNCAAALDHALLAAAQAPAPHVVQGSATAIREQAVDVVVTDPPYYDAIPYSDLMDLFYIWLRRSLHGLGPAFAHFDAHELSPKWNHATNDGELIDDETRHAGDKAVSKKTYEDGMFRAFQQCHSILVEDGRLVIVFAHKQPDAWETLVSALIRAGFVVDASWPIQTENATRSRARASAALASSLWLICRKRPGAAGIGWDNRVIEEMRSNISGRLQQYWDAGIRGPDFIWAATGPALEAYSQHPVVRKANGPGTMGVSEFLSHVRRIVVDYVVGQVLSGKDAESGSAGSGTAADRLDEPTAYYLLHRNDFGLGDAPAGTVILYAVSCGLADRDLMDTWELVSRVGDDVAESEENDDEDDPDSDISSGPGGKGSTIRLKRWSERTGRSSASIGFEAPGGRPVPLIDRVHRVMQLYKAGDISKVDEYLDEHGLRRHELFKRVIQSLIEVSRRERGTAAGGRDDHGDETTILEALSNHIGAKGAKRQTGQRELSETTETWTPTSASAE